MLCMRRGRGRIPTDPDRRISDTDTERRTWLLLVTFEVLKRRDRMPVERQSARGCHIEQSHCT